MKKLLSIALLCTLLLSLVIFPASAAERKNVMAIEGETYVIVDTNAGGWNHVVERIFDGRIGHTDNDTTSFCTLIIPEGADAVFNGTNLHYDLDGVEDEDSPYIYVLQFELENAYTVDGFKFYVGDGETALFYCNADGFDILLSENGAPNSWKKVYSGTDLLCGGQYKIHETEDGLQSAYIEADFEPTKAQYVAIALTQPRCIHEDALLTRYPDVPQITTRPDYWEITEFELYEYDPAAATTTVAPETTTTPETTTVAPETTTVAPETTTVAPDTTTVAPDTTTVAPDTTTAPTATTVAPTQTPDTADILPIACVALMLAAAACLALRKKFN